MLWVSHSLGFSKIQLIHPHRGICKPRHVKVRMPQVSSLLVEQKLLTELHFSSNRPPLVHHRDRLYICAYGGIVGADGVFIVFDTEEESFRRMCGPTQRCHHGNLFDKEGTLAF